MGMGSLLTCLMMELPDTPKLRTHLRCLSF